MVATPPLTISWGWVLSCWLICSTSPIWSMIPATMPQWSRSCTLIEDAIGVMAQKYHSSPNLPAEYRLKMNL